MEFERFDDDSIKIIISSEDLSSRGVKFLDLMGNHKQIEEFFYNILEEVDTDNKFTRGDPVTFQVVPTQKGLDLYVNKKIFKNMQQDIDGKMYPVYTPAELTEEWNRNNKRSKKSSPNKLDESNKYIYKMADFESLVQIANKINLTNLQTILYKYQEFYYLEFEFSEQCDPDDVLESLAILHEHADLDDFSHNDLAKKGKVIIDKDVLNTIKKYFI